MHTSNTNTTQLEYSTSDLTNKGDDISFKQAYNDLEWRQVIQDKMDTIERNKT